MNKNKGVFIDLDGTLLNSQRKITPFTKEVINKVRELGIKIYLITGKSLVNCIAYYQELELDTILISSMGQVISKPNDKSFTPIVSPVCSQDLQELIADIEQEFGVTNFLYETYDNQFLVKHEGSSNLINLITEGHKYKIYNDEPLDNIIGSYFEVNVTPEEELVHKTKFLNVKWKNKFETAFWQTDGNLPIIQIKPSHVGKSLAMQEVIKLDQLDYTYAFGNGWSDRNMLVIANEGYAMINASDKVKSYTKYVTQFDNDHDGVALELNRIFMK